jgi:hypothetical protein
MKLKRNVYLIAAETLTLQTVGYIHCTDDVRK